ncbi:hypothetical protein ECFRIK1997_5974, partial [Escherichia coli FRIK1997]
LPQQPQLAGQQLRQLRRQGRGLLALAGAERAHHRGDVGQGAAAEVLTDLLVGRVRGAGGDQGGGGVFNAADGVRGEGCHGLAPVSQGMAPSYARYEKYTIHTIQFIHTVQNLHTLFLFSWSDPVSGGYGSSSPSAQRYIPSAQHAVPHSVAHGTICCVVSLDCDAPRRGGKQRYDDFLRWYTSGKSFIQIKSDPYETGMR